MRKTYLLMLVSGFIMQTVFADDAMMSANTKSCDDIAKACLSAGFSRHDNEDKKFWSDCMKPILLGKTVKDVTVDAKTVKSCRTDKIKALKKELNEFKKVSS